MIQFSIYRKSTGQDLTLIYALKKKKKKTSQQARLEENCLSLISASVKKLSANVVLTDERLNAFLIR